MPTVPIAEMPRLPAVVRGIALVGSAAAVLSALGILWLVVSGSMNGEKLPYDAVAFEILACIAGVFGVLVGLGWYRSGPGMVLISVAGTVAAAGLLGLLGDTSYYGIPRFGVKTIGGANTTHWRNAQLLIGALLAAAAVLTVLSRRPQASFRAAAIGVAMGIPALAIAGGIWSMRGSMSSWAPIVQGGVIVFGGLIVLGFFAASVHMIIRAFELGGQDALAKPQ